MNSSFTLHINNIQHYCEHWLVKINIPVKWCGEFKSLLPK